MNEDSIGLTRQADALLQVVPIDERARVGNWAKVIAQANGRARALKADVLSAMLCAEPEFLPDPGEYVDDWAAAQLDEIIEELEREGIL